MAKLLDFGQVELRLGEKIKKAIAWFNSLTPEQQAEHRKAQAESWVRGMTARCEHGELDFEQCPKCREEASSG